MKCSLNALILVMLITFQGTVMLSGCDPRDGDYLGPAERTARTLTNGWDMWNTDSITPYEAAHPLPVDGTKMIEGRTTYGQAQLVFTNLSDDEKTQRSAQMYRRYCHHCHGPNGDGRIIVGESFDVRLPDLRSQSVQKKDDELIFNQLVNGSANMIPLSPTMTPLEMILAIHHLRTLTDAPSTPYFTPKSTQPLQE